MKMRVCVDVRARGAALPETVQLAVRGRTRTTGVRALNRKCPPRSAGLRVGERVGGARAVCGVLARRGMYWRR